MQRTTKKYLFLKIKKDHRLFQWTIISFTHQLRERFWENPRNKAPEHIFQRTVSLERAPSKPTIVKIGFKNGDPISINNKQLNPEKLLEKLNLIGGKNGVGRVDLVENRFLGIKSRGVYETPGGEILYFAHRAMESVTLDKETMHQKERIMPIYSELVYNGYWFSKKD